MKKSKQVVKVQYIKELVDYLSNTDVKLILISGIPGAGKSTLAKNLSNVFNCKHYEADQYFETSNGYQFNANKLKYAHLECQKNTIDALNSGERVIVANTFTTDWELDIYFKMRRDAVLIQMTGDYTNVHDCPAHTILTLKERLSSRKTLPDFVCDKNINKN